MGSVSMRYSKVSSSCVGVEGARHKGSDEEEERGFCTARAASRRGLGRGGTQSEDLSL